MDSSEPHEAQPNHLSSTDELVQGIKYRKGCYDYYSLKDVAVLQVSVQGSRMREVASPVSDQDSHRGDNNQANNSMLIDWAIGQRERATLFYTSPSSSRARPAP